MTAAVQSHVEGLEASRRALEAILRSTTDAAIPQALDVIGQQWTTEVQKRAPLLTGRLRRSYTWEVGKGRKARYVEVSSNVKYAPYQEFGTRRNRAQPHLRPGTQAVIPQVGRLIVEGVRRDRAGFRGGMGRSPLGSLQSMAGRLGALG